MPGGRPASTRKTPAARDQNNDIVRLYNDRGSVLCIAVVTGRSPRRHPQLRILGQVRPADPRPADSPDKGGCVNMLTPSRMVSKNAPGMTPNSCLIEIEKWEG
jgi:anaerobic selenocysteine-containing dehydrogenase